MVIVECGGNVSWWSGLVRASGPVVLNQSCCGHVTLLCFEMRALSWQRVGSGVEMGMAGHVVGALGYVPSVGWCVVGLGRWVVRLLARMVQSGGFGWVPGSRRGWGWLLGVVRLCVLTL
jgi:hypothetical protein